jgi:transcriptional regulator with XRE-family HTH domain
MSNNNYWDEEDDINTQFDGASEGGDLVKQLRKQLKMKDKELGELTGKLSTYEKRDREDTVRKVLEKQGVTNPKAARLVLKDIEGDITEQAVVNWLETDGDVFGYQAPDKSVLSEEDRSELKRQENLTQGATTPDRGEDLEMRIAAANSPEELSRILYSQS